MPAGTVGAEILATTCPERAILASSLGELFEDIDGVTNVRPAGTEVAVPMPQGPVIPSSINCGRPTLLWPAAFHRLTGWVTLGVLGLMEVRGMAQEYELKKRRSGDGIRACGRQKKRLRSNQDHALMIRHRIPVYMRRGSFHVSHFVAGAVKMNVQSFRGQDREHAKSPLCRIVSGHAP